MLPSPEKEGQQMTISIRKERILTFAAAAAWWSEKIGQAVGPNTLYRWSRRGCLAADGTRVKLEVVQHGRKLATSAEALDRLMQTLGAIRQEVHRRSHGESLVDGNPLRTTNRPTRKRLAAVS
jgi:hypothetical protein